MNNCFKPNDFLYIYPLNNQFIINLHTDSEEKTRAEKTIEQEKFELKINLEIQIFIVRQSFNMNFPKEFLHVKSSFENVSNEIFHEIFDYLDGYDIYRAFSKLNHRFENLIHGLMMKIEFSSTSQFDNHYKQFLKSSKHQIVSLHSNNESILNAFIKFHIIQSFDHLESLVLNSISTYKLFVFCYYLISESQISSLTIYLNDYHDNLRDLFSLCFRLPQLKYLKLKLLSRCTGDIPVRMPYRQMFFSIKYLIINFGCHHNQLMNLLFYLQQLVHLSCDYLMKSTTDTQFDLMIQLNQLTYLSIVVDDIDLNELETFLCRLCSQLEVFRIKIRCSDENYLDGNRWENLILEKMVSLKKFSFCYTFSTDKHFNVMMSHPFGSINNRFTNS